jgi:hypothetical protein
MRTYIGLWVTYSAIETGLAAPYRLAAPIDMQTISTPIRRHSDLKVDARTSEFINSLQRDAKQGGFCQEDTAIDLSGNLPGVVFVIGGRMPVSMDFRRLSVFEPYGPGIFDEGQSAPPRALVAHHERNSALLCAARIAIDGGRFCSLPLAPVWRKVPRVGGVAASCSLFWLFILANVGAPLVAFVLPENKCISIIAFEMARDVRAVGKKYHRRAVEEAVPRFVNEELSIRRPQQHCSDTYDDHDRQRLPKSSSGWIGSHRRAAMRV